MKKKITELEDHVNALQHQNKKLGENHFRAEKTYDEEVSKNAKQIEKMNELKAKNEKETKDLKILVAEYEMEIKKFTSPISTNVSSRFDEKKSSMTMTTRLSQPITFNTRFIFNIIILFSRSFLNSKEIH